MSRTELGFSNWLRLRLARRSSSFRPRRLSRGAVERAVGHLNHRAGLGRLEIDWLPSPSAVGQLAEFQMDRTAVVEQLRDAIIERQTEHASKALEAVRTSDVFARFVPDPIAKLGQLRGHSDLGWTALAHFVERRMKQSLLLRHREDLAAFRTAARGSLCWFHAANRCIIIDRPRRNRRTPKWLRDNLPDARHAVFGDGTDVVVWANRMVEGGVIWEPTHSDIVAEPNLFVRQLLLERHGVDEFFKQAAAQLIHVDQTGRLYDIRTTGEPLRLVRVINSTPEPDGTYKEYILRVPPWVHRAREAVAWTFGLDEFAYEPAIET